MTKYKLTREQSEKFVTMQNLFANLMQEHDPDKKFDRNLHLNHGRRMRGVCIYPFADEKGRVEISRYLLDEPIEGIEDTIRHEVAHCIAGHAAGHGRAWKRAAVLVGARPERCGVAMSSAEKTAPYSVDCEKCGSVATRFKLTKAFKDKVKRGTCAHCGGSLTLSNRAIIEK